MKMGSRLTIAAVAGTCLAPGLAFAQASGSNTAATPAVPTTYDNQVSVGAQYQSSDSAQYGRYNGSPNSGGAFIGSFSLGHRDAWDSGGTQYYNATGTNLSTDGSLFMPDASGSVSYGKQGQWGVRLYYDGDTYFQSQHFHTVYSTSGGLAPGVTAGGTPWYNSAQLSGSLLDEAAKTKRDKVGGEVFYLFGESWALNSGFSHEHKEGIRENSLLFGAGKSAVPNGTAPATAEGDLVYFPQPVDYDTDRYTLSLGYNRPDFQTLLSYTMSSFTDNNTSFKAFDPFTSPSAAPTNTNALGPGAIAASYALPPSNSAHEFKALFGYNVTPTTRLAANLGYTLELQDDNFAPSTFNPNVPASSFSTPRSSLGGLVNNFFGNVIATAQPIARTDLRASYTVNYRDNRTPQSTYLAPENDSIAPPSPMHNVALSFRDQQIQLEGGYRIVPSTKLTLGYIYKLTDRNNAEVNHNTENTVSLRANTNFGSGISGMVELAHGVRTASNINVDRPWLAMGYPASEAPQVTFFDAPRTTNSMRSYISMALDPQISVGLNTKVAYNHYFATTAEVNGTAVSSSSYMLGLTDDHTATVGPDLNYAPNTDLNFNTYYNFEEIFRNQVGPGASTTTPAFAGWNESTTDQVHTFGVSGVWNAIEDLLKLGASYNFSYGSTSYALGDGVIGFTGTGAGLNYIPVPLPNVTSQLHSISLHAEYQFTQQLAFWVGYTFERYLAKDFNTGYPTTQYGNALLPNNPNPSYVEHIIGVQARYRW